MHIEGANILQLESTRAVSYVFLFVKDCFLIGKGGVVARSRLEKEIGNIVARSVRNAARRKLNKYIRKGGAPFVLVFLVALGVLGIKGGGDGVDESKENNPAVVEDSERTASRRALPQEQRVEIERCVDGDTLIVRYELDGESVRERVRLIGVNTPETVKPNSPVEPFGPEASAYTKRRVEETGGVAMLVSDGSAYDKYNRRLAFVYLGGDTISLNEDLARQGLGKVELQYSYSQEMKERLQNCANLAKRERLGIYGGN